LIRSHRTFHLQNATQQKNQLNGCKIDGMLDF